MNKDYSSNPGKQRLRAFTAPLHLARGKIGCHLSKELKKELKKRSLTLRTKDTVKVLRGSSKGKTGKVTAVNIDGKALIEKITRKKSDGTEIQLPIHVSNLLLIDLDRTDKKRLKTRKAA